MDLQNEFANQSNEELLLKYKETQDIQIKQELTLRYVPIVKRVAIQMRDVYVSFAQVDDIINEGVLTIMSSIDKFEPNKNVKFESYIAKRIRGLVIDIARKQDWVPRGTRKNAKNIDNVINNLYNEMGRAPTDDEIANAMGIGKEQYYEELRKNNLFHVLSLDMLMEESADRSGNSSEPRDQQKLPEQLVLDEELKEHLREGIRQLRENEQFVISLYYNQEVSIKAIARIMRISEPRVSQIHGNAVKKLRQYMERF
ncbi:MAG: FliA/WhiG family RNA polymerase sigma factor [Hungatella sp.]